MGRKKTLTDEVLAIYYKDIVKALKDLDRPCYADELMQLTGYNRAKIGKALQWGRREFENGKIKITDYVMASPEGYFLPSKGREVVAYVVQNIKYILSMSRTQTPIYDYAMSRWKDELQAAFAEKDEDAFAINDEMNPWEVFKNIMSKED